MARDAARTAACAWAIEQGAVLEQAVPEPVGDTWKRDPLAPDEPPPVEEPLPLDEALPPDELLPPDEALPLEELLPLEEALPLELLDEP